MKKGIQLDRLNTFPLPIVIRRDNAPIGETQYKVRRAWGICAIDACEDFVANIISSEDFRNRIAAIRFFDGEEALLEDFRNERLKKYRDKYLMKSKIDARFETVVISTTFHIDDSKIRFSIHPASDVIGVVSDSFTV